MMNLIRLKVRPRFSLRAIFFATAFVGALCYWLILPSITAERFVRAVTTENYESADACFRDADDAFLFDWNEKRWRFKAQAGLEPWSFRELMRGERQVRLQVMYGDAGPMRTRNWTVIATRAGLLSPDPAWGGGGGGGGIDTPLIPTAPTS